MLSARHPRYPLLDGVRALSALSVVLLHVAIFTAVFQGAFYQRLIAHLDVGVPLFFLVSGFVMYRPMLAARVLALPATGLLDYARRRFARVAPAYWTALTAAAVYPGVHGVFTGNWWVYYGLLQNFPVYEFTADCRAEVLKCGLGPAWTLAVEVVFYAVLPFYALLSGRLAALLRRRVGWVRVELALLALVALASLPIQGLAFGFDAWLFYSPLGRGWWFGLGMALAVVSVQAQQRGAAPAVVRRLAEHPGRLWGAAAAVYVVAALGLLPTGPGLGFPLGDRGTYLAEYIGAGLLAAAVAVPALFGDGLGGWPRRVLAQPVLAWIGTISYGLYLWHFPVLLALYAWGVPGWVPAPLAFPLTAALTLLVSCAIAALSFRLVEQPAMRWAARPRRAPRVVATPRGPARDARGVGSGAPEGTSELAGGLAGHG